MEFSNPILKYSLIGLDDKFFESTKQKLSRVIFGQKISKNMSRSQLQDSIERWLFHENYSFKESKTKEDVFRFIINGLGAYKIPIEVFEPEKQLGAIVLGGKIFLQNRHTARFLKLNEEEQQKFKNSVKGFCDSISAVHKIFREDGKVVVGVYVVLDNVEQFTQQIVLDAITQVLEMSEKTSRFIMKTF